MITHALSLQGQQVHVQDTIHSTANTDRKFLNYIAITHPECWKPSLVLLFLVLLLGLHSLRLHNNYTHSRSFYCLLHVQKDSHYFPYCITPNSTHLFHCGYHVVFLYSQLTNFIAWYNTITLPCFIQLTQISSHLYTLGHHIRLCISHCVFSLHVSLQISEKVTEGKCLSLVLAHCEMLHIVKNVSNSITMWPVTKLFFMFF